MLASSRGRTTLLDLWFCAARLLGGAVRPAVSVGDGVVVVGSRAAEFGRHRKGRSCKLPTERGSCPRGRPRGFCLLPSPPIASPLRMETESLNFIPRSLFEAYFDSWKSSYGPTILL